MKITAFIFIAFFGVVCCGKAKRERFDEEYAHSSAIIENHGYDVAELALQAAHGKGYSVGSGLRSIAQGSADQAHSAVTNQHTAAVQAAYVAKNTLAQTAIQSAATALAALAGKEVLLEGLEQQNIEAHQDLEADIVQLQLAKKSALAAKQTAQQAAHHVSILTSALNGAQAVSEHAEQAAHEAAAELASQAAMIGKAKARLESISQKFNAAHIDFEATKAAAEKATASAHEAQSNAANAAAHAEAKLHEAVAHQVVSHPVVAHQSISYVSAEIPTNHHYSH